jgi:hypothetical protein
VRQAQKRWCEGFRARQCETPPTVQVGETRKGRPRVKIDQRASLAHMAEERCPKTRVLPPLPGASPYAPERRGPVPAHERERWIAGFLHADSIAVAHGHTHLSRCNPERPVRSRREKQAEPLEVFPEAVLSKDGARARRHNALLRGLL